MALRRDFLVNSLDLVALSCLAVSQPIFDLLEKNVEFLAARDSDATDVVVLAVAVTLLVPIFLALVELIAGLIGQRTLANVHRLLVGILVFLLLLPPLKHLSHHRVGALLIVVAVLAAGVISETYVRLRSRGIALAYLSPIAIVLPALFVFHLRSASFWSLDLRHNPFIRRSGQLRRSSWWSLMSFRWCP